MVSSCLGLLGENYHMYQVYQVIKVLKYFPLKEVVGSLRALTGPAQPPPTPAHGLGAPLQLSLGLSDLFPTMPQEWNLPLFLWLHALLLLDGSLGWSLALLHALVCWGLPRAPAGTTEEEWDSVSSCSSPQPQLCRSIQVLWYFLERTAIILLKCWSVVSNARLVFQAFWGHRAFFLNRNSYLPPAPPRSVPSLCTFGSGLYY